LFAIEPSKTHRLYRLLGERTMIGSLLSGEEFPAERVFVGDCCRSRTSCGMPMAVLSDTFLCFTGPTSISSTWR